MNRFKHRKGFTLVEMVITMTLLAIFFTSATVVLGSFTRVYYKVQELNRALLIGDTILQSVEEQLKAASRIDEIYTDAENGQVILFTDSDGIYRLFDTRGGTRSIEDYLGVVLGEPVETVEGQLWLSYYHTTPPDLSVEATYATTKGVEQIVGSDFYKNNHIKLSFLPGIINDGGVDKVQYMEVTVEVWMDNRMITKTKGVIQMQYLPGIG